MTNEWCEWLLNDRNESKMRQMAAEYIGKWLENDVNESWMRWMTEYKISCFPLTVA